MPPLRDNPRSQGHGFTLIELMISVSIIAILAGIVVPMYLSAMRNARVAKAKGELRTISTAIDMFRAKHAGVLPVTLAEVGHGGRLDPWGYPYMFLNFSTGTGSGMNWAIRNKLIDPSVLPALDGEGLIDSTASFNFTTYDLAINGVALLPPLSAPKAITVNAAKRRDQFLFPLNTDYDLFSMGPDRLTALSGVEDVTLQLTLKATPSVTS